MSGTCLDTHWVDLIYRSVLIRLEGTSRSTDGFVYFLVGSGLVSRSFLKVRGGVERWTQLGDSWLHSVWAQCVWSLECA